MNIKSLPPLHPLHKLAAAICERANDPELLSSLSPDDRAKLTHLVDNLRAASEESKARYNEDNEATDTPTASDITAAESAAEPTREEIDSVMKGQTIFSLLQMDVDFCKDVFALIRQHYGTQDRTFAFAEASLELLKVTVALAALASDNFDAAIKLHSIAADSFAAVVSPYQPTIRAANRSKF